MAWKPGQTGNPLGAQSRDKPFRDALRMEINQAADGKALRRIAAQLITKAEAGDLQAIMAIADRLDGKPAQESTVTNLTLRPAEMTDEEVAAGIARLREGSGRTGASAGDAGPPPGSAKLN